MTSGVGDGTGVVVGIAVAIGEGVGVGFGACAGTAVGVVVVLHASAARDIRVTAAYRRALLFNRRRIPCEFPRLIEMHIGQTLDSGDLQLAVELVNS